MTEARNERLAGTYAFRQIYTLINEIGAASNPETPTEIAGRVYKRLDDFVKFVDDFIPEGATEVSEEVKPYLRQHAISYMRQITQDLLRLSDLTHREYNWLKSLKIVNQMMEDIISGEVVARFEEERASTASFDAINQMPDDLSWHGPE